MLSLNIGLFFDDCKLYNLIQGDYMIKINIDNLMNKKSISRYRLQQLTNWNYRRINALYNSKVKYITTEEIETLCNLLECSPGELIRIETKTEE